MLRNKIPDHDVEFIMASIIKLGNVVNIVTRKLMEALKLRNDHEIEKYRRGAAADSIRIHALESILANKPITKDDHQKLMMKEELRKNDTIRNYANIVDSYEDILSTLNTNPSKREVEDPTEVAKQEDNGDDITSPEETTLPENDAVETHRPGEKARVATIKEAKSRFFVPPVYSDEFAVDELETTAQQWQTRKDPKIQIHISVKKKQPAQQPETRDIKRHLDSSMQDEVGSSANVQDSQNDNYKRTR